MYVSDKPNYPLVRTLLASLQRDLRWFLDPPDGSREHPATTCLELWLVNTSISNGKGPVGVYSTAVCCFLRILTTNLFVGALQLVTILRYNSELQHRGQ